MNSAYWVPSTSAAAEEGAPLQLGEIRLPEVLRREAVDDWVQAAESRKNIRLSIKFSIQLSF